MAPHGSNSVRLALCVFVCYRHDGMAHGPPAFLPKGVTKGMIIGARSRFAYPQRDTVAPALTYSVWQQRRKE